MFLSFSLTYTHTSPFPLISHRHTRNPPQQKDKSPPAKDRPPQPEAMSVSFSVEYASTGRAACKDSACKGVIDKGTLRIAKLSPSPFDPDKVRVGARV